MPENTSIHIDKNSVKDKKLLKDLRDLRVGIKDRVELYQKLPDSKKELWLSKDTFMRELFEFAKKLMDGKNDN